MEKWLKISADDHLSLVELPSSLDDSCSSFLNGCYRELDCDTIEIVRVSQFDVFFKGFCPVLIIDECGKLKDKRCNSLCSLFYAAPFDFIVGDALLGHRVGPDIFPFTVEQYRTFVDTICSVFSNLKF